MLIHFDHCDIFIFSLLQLQFYCTFIMSEDYASSLVCELLIQNILFSDKEKHTLTLYIASIKIHNICMYVLFILSVCP